MTQVAPALVPIYSGTPRFVDGSGQRVLLRGVNVMGDSGSGVYAHAVEMGVNMVRIVVHWNKGEVVAPQGSGTNWSAYTHTFDASYLGGIETMVAYFKANGIYVQIDSHQASWSPIAPFSGFGGIPGWYYSDARFPGHATLASCSNVVGCAIASWWTSAAEQACNQVFYNAWWDELIRRFSAYDNVVMYQVFNEPNPGSMGGSSLSKLTTMHGWLAPIVNHMRTQDPNRAIAVMNRGGGQGYGTVDYAPFGGAAGLQAKKMVIEHHSYYTGLAPGFPASASVAGQVGYNAAGDDYVPDSATTHNTTSNSSYHGTLANQQAYYSVPISKGAAMGVPVFYGEFGVNNTDPGRLAFISQMQQLMDGNAMDGTVWLLGATSGANSLNLLTGGALNDMGTAWKAWFQATDFTPAGGSGGGGGGGSTGTGSGTIATDPTPSTASPDFYDPTWTSGSHAGRVESILAVSGVVYVAGRFGHVIDVDGTDFGAAGANTGPYAFLAAIRADTGAIIRTWQTGINGFVRKLRLDPNGHIIYAVGDFSAAGGQTRNGIVAFSALSGPTDTSAFVMHNHPQPNPFAGGSGAIYAIEMNGPGNVAYLAGDFTNGIKRYTIDTSTEIWTEDTSWAGHPGPIVRAIIFNDDASKLIAGGTFTGGMAAFNTPSGTTAAWAYTPGASPGIFSLDSAARQGLPAEGICYVGGGADSGDMLAAVDFATGGGPNTHAPVGACQWYRDCDGNVQVVRVGQFGGQTVVFAGHHGDVVQTAPDTTTGTTKTSHGLFSCQAGSEASGGGRDAGYGGPPNFTSPSSSGDPLKLWAIFQVPSTSDLLVGGDFTAVNGEAANAHRRYAKFPGSAAPTGWSPQPSLSDTTPQVGQTLTCDPGVLAGATAYAFQWAWNNQGSWQVITGATSATFTVTSTYVNQTIRCRVDATTPTGVQTAYANVTGAVQPAGSAPVNTAPPSISPGSGAVGSTFTALTHAADWTPTSGLTFTYQWQRKVVATGVISNIAGATGTTYVAQTADNGNQIRVMVTATGSTGTGTAPSAYSTVGTIQSRAVIWFISDAGSSSHAVNVVNNCIPAGGTGVDLVIYGGDIYARGTAADEAADITALYGPSGRNVFSKMVVMCGNHDWANRDCPGGYRAFIAANFPQMDSMLPDGIGKITLAGCDLIFLNDAVAAQTLVGDCTESAALLGDSQVGLGSAQLSQLQTWMSEHGTNAIVFSHHQRYSCGSNHGDITSNTPLWQALQPATYGGNGGAVAHVHGHEHDYQRMRPRDATGLVATDTGFKGPGVVSFCGGDGGEGNYDLNASYPSKYIASFRGASASPVYGALRITISGSTVTFDHFAEDGVTITDTATMTTVSGQGAPPSSGVPSILNLTGHPQVGQSLTCDGGSWVGDMPMDFTFQWQHSLDGGGTWLNCSGSGAFASVPGQTDGNAQSAYAVASSDASALLRCSVTVANAAGSAVGLSAATQSVSAASSGSGPPVLLTAPTVTPPIAAVGLAVTTTNGSWTSPTGSGLTYAYQWNRVNPNTGVRVPISGATTPTYTAQTRDVGFRLQADVSATNTGTGAGTTVASSSATQAIVSTSISVNVQIDTQSGQRVQVGHPFTVVWEAHTNSPGGILGTLIRIDGGAYQQGTQIADDGAGGGTYSFTFPTLSVGAHQIDVEALANSG